MEPSEKWEKLVLLGVFLSGALLVGVGIYLSQVPAGESFGQPEPALAVEFSEQSSASDDLPYGESWCDQMMEKPNGEWQGDEFILFSQHCLNPASETPSSQ